MGSNLLSTSSKRSSIIKDIPPKKMKIDDLSDNSGSKMHDDDSSEDESIQDIDAAEHNSDSTEDDIDENKDDVSDGDDGSGESSMDEDEEQSDNTSETSENDEIDDNGTLEKEGDGVDFSDSDENESEGDVNIVLEENGDSDIKVAANPAWAQAMAKILRTQKPVGKKAVVLSKAKTIQAAESAAAKKEEQQPDFEVVGEKEAQSVVKSEDIKPTEEELLIAKKERLAQCRIKQEDFDYNRERALTKIATKGVVQLFNAVRAQQKDLGSKLAEAHSTRMGEKLLQSIDKNSFLEHLTGKIRSRPVEEVAIPAKKKEEGDFMLPKSWNELSKTVESYSWDKEIKIKDEPED